MCVEESVENLTTYVNRGITPKYTEGHEDSILILNQKCIRDFKVSLEPARLNDLKKRKVTEGKTLLKYDVLINSTGVGTLGRVAQFFGETGSATVDSHITIVRPNQQLIDPVYFGYLLKEKQSQIEGFAEGTTGQTELARDAVKELKLRLVKNKEQQKQIGKSLLDLDKKIELNCRTNRTLEEMAQAVFKSWFVDFDPTRAKIKARENGQDPTRAAMAAIAGKTVDQLDTLSPDQIKSLTATAALFPDALLPSELGEIPQGWKLKNIGDIVDRLKPKKRYTKKQLERYGSVPVLEQGASIVMGYHNDKAGFLASPENPLFIFGDHTCVVHLSCENFDISSNVIPLMGKGYPTIWVYYAIQDKQKFQEYRRHWSEFVVKDVVVPCADLSKAYSLFVTSLYKQKEQLARETKTLEQLRDSLLPKLLSGEIDVSELVEAGQ